MSNYHELLNRAINGDKGALAQLAKMEAPVAAPVEAPIKVEAPVAEVKEDWKNKKNKNKKEEAEAPKEETPAEPEAE